MSNGNGSNIIVSLNLPDAVTAAASYAQAAATSATAAAVAAGGATTAANIAYTNHFYGIMASDPTTRPDGSSMQNGDMYFNSPYTVLKMFFNGVWNVVAMSIVGGTLAGTLLALNNLSDLSNAASARVNLGLGGAAVQPMNAFLQPGNNLADVGNPATARANLGIASTLSTSAICQTANNLSDLTSVSTARTNLGLGSVAVLNTSSVCQTANNLADVSSVAAVRTNLGLGTAATANVTAFMQSANNLSDVANTGTALSNLGGLSAIGTFGDGLDGNVTISTSVSLSRDMYYNNLTLTAGAALNPNGYRIFVANTLTISAAPAGAISVNGNSAVPSSSSGASASILAGTIGGSSAGANGGGTLAAAGANAASGRGNGGSGGNGGTASGAGGAGGIATSVSFSRFALPGMDISVSPPSAIPGGLGGGGGGGGFSSGTGGGGGGSAGVVVIIAKTIARGTNSTAGIIQLIGGTAASVPNVGGGSAGGGGGGGGYLLLIVGNLTGSVISNAIDLSAGAGGTGIANGQAGGTGQAWILNLGAQTMAVTATVAPSGLTNTKQINL